MNVMIEPVQETYTRIAVLEAENAAIKEANRSLVLGTVAPTPEGKLVAEILAELARARSKFPGDNLTGFAHGEEFGELCKALMSESRQRVREEAVQVAVMAIRVVLDGDHSLNKWRAEHGLNPLLSDPTYFIPDEEVWKEHPDARYISTGRSGIAFKHRGLDKPEAKGRATCYQSANLQDMASIKHNDHLVEDWIDSLFERPAGV